MITIDPKSMIQDPHYKDYKWGINEGKIFLGIPNKDDSYWTGYYSVISGTLLKESKGPNCWTVTPERVRVWYTLLYYAVIHTITLTQDKTIKGYMLTQKVEHLRK